MGRMTSTTSSQELGRKIEELVRAHIAASRREVAAAVERALAGAEMAVAARPGSTRGDKKPGRRRGRAEIAALAERFYEVVRATPGETMKTLAERLGTSAQVLHVPVASLKEAGRVRSVGQRHQTRYFPMTGSRSAAA